MKQIIYTVGHSNQSADEFLQLITPQGINCIIDVRSTPYSKYTPQFNEDVLKSYLSQHGILYAPFGKHFGARREDCLNEVEITKRGQTTTQRQVDFEMGIKTKAFLEGVERIKVALSQDRKIAFLCSEADPLSCHRFSFISRYFYENGFEVLHIVRSNDTGKSVTISHHELENMMINNYVARHKLKPLASQAGCLSFDFGEDSYSESDQRVDAYRIKNREIGWVANEENNDIDIH